MQHVPCCPGNKISLLRYRSNSRAQLKRHVFNDHVDLDHVTAIVMDLSPSVVSALQVAGDPAVISDDSFAELVKVCLDVIVRRQRDIDGNLGTCSCYCVATRGSGDIYIRIFALNEIQQNVDV